MPVYDFTALDTLGAKTVGRREAPNTLALSGDLRQAGLFLLASTERIKRQRKVRSAPWKPRVLVEFTERLEILAKAGIPLALALSQLVDDTRDPAVRSVIEDLYATIDSGQALSVGLARHPRVFDQTYVTVVAAGEESGSLEKVLGTLAKRLTFRGELRAQIKSALTYPLMLGIALFGLVLVILLVLVPRISVIFEKAQVAPPPSTLFLLASKDFVLGHWHHCLMVGGAIIFGGRVLLRRPHIRIAWETLLTKIPAIGWLFVLSETAVLTNVLALLNSCGVTMTRALDLAGDAVRTLRIRTAVREIVARVTRGEGLSESVKAVNCFPPLFVQMVAVGERSGSLEDTLGRVETWLEREIPRLVKGMVALINPIITVASGLVVGFAIFAVVTPIFAVMQALKGGHH